MFIKEEEKKKSEQKPADIISRSDKEKPSYPSELDQRGRC